jgi:hypothetical protein
VVVGDVAYGYDVGDGHAPCSCEFLGKRLGKSIKCEKPLLPFRAAIGLPPGL